MPESYLAYSYPLRPHTAVLIEQLLFLQATIVILSLLLGSPLVAFQSTIETLTSASGIYILVALLLQLMNTILVIIIVLNWAHTLYIIKPGEVTVQHGVWHIREETHPVGHGELVGVRQSMLGRFFNYGTLRLHGGMIEGEVRLEHIPDSHRYTEIIKQSEKKEVITILPGHEGI